MLRPASQLSDAVRQSGAGIRSSSATVNGRPAAGQASAIVTTLMVPLLYMASTLPGACDISGYRYHHR
jgi:hypothetical protein